MKISIGISDNKYVFALEYDDGGVEIIDEGDLHPVSCDLIIDRSRLPYIPNGTPIVVVPDAPTLWSGRLVFYNRGPECVRCWIDPLDCVDHDG